MMTSTGYKFLGFFISILFFAFCKKKNTDTLVIPLLSVSSSEVVFSAEGGVSEVLVSSNAKWSISNSASWCTATASATEGNGKVSLNVQSNSATAERSTIISLSSGNLLKQIKVRQSGKAVGDSIPADATGMSSNAVQIAAKIKLGWNLGNTLEAIGSETAWGNPKASKALIDKVKQSGFNAVRIPCSWNQYIVNPFTNQIKTEWLDRVKEVVQYCVDNDMYVLLNIHWDGGWLDEHINTQDQVSVNEKQKALWKQIATRLRDFDEHLMFASANEPPVDNATQMSVLLSYHQTFINTVRSTGGRNSYRVLVIQGPSTDIDKTATLMNALPSDPTPNKMMAEVHYYGPWQFCGLTEDASWGKIFHYWGKDYHSTTDASRNPSWNCEEDYVIEEFQKMKTKFVDKGIPVVLGEYGAIRRTGSLTGDALTLHLASRAYWNKYITKQAKTHGMLPFYWDEGSIGNNGFGIFNRQSNTVFDQQVLDSLILGAQ
jgi:aryl-phospho-beta-D-glucosidase BglC (GH1 family)